MPPGGVRETNPQEASLDPRSLAVLSNWHIAFALLPTAICRRWRTYPFDRTADGIRVSSQIGRSFVLDLPDLSAKSVPIPRRESCNASIRRASVLRFVPLAFPLSQAKFAGRIHFPSFVFFCTSFDYIVTYMVYNVLRRTSIDKLSLGASSKEEKKKRDRTKAIVLREITKAIKSLQRIQLGEMNAQKNRKYSA